MAKRLREIDCSEIKHYPVTSNVIIGDGGVICFVLIQGANTIVIPMGKEDTLVRHIVELRNETGMGEDNNGLPAGL